MTRVTLGGRELEGFAIELPAASVRMLLPEEPGAKIEMPLWNGNEFLSSDGSRPPIRTFTPRRFRRDSLELEVEVVVHGPGVASQWAASASPGTWCAVSGPGRGYVVDQLADAYFILGDETAIPAISQILESIAVGKPAEVHVEVVDTEARIDLPKPSGAIVTWHELPTGGSPGSTLLSAVEHAELGEGTRVWAAGEAAAMQKIRNNLFRDRGWSRAEASVRGYWKLGRRGDAEPSGPE